MQSRPGVARQQFGRVMASYNSQVAWYNHDLFFLFLFCGKRWTILPHLINEHNETNCIKSILFQNYTKWHGLATTVFHPHKSLAQHKLILLSFWRSGGLFSNMVKEYGQVWYQLCQLIPLLKLEIHEVVSKCGFPDWSNSGAQVRVKIST